LGKDIKGCGGYDRVNQQLRVTEGSCGGADSGERGAGLGLALVRERQAGQRISVTVGRACPVQHLELIFLQQQNPSGGLTNQIGSAKKPLQRLVISVQGEG